MLAKTCLASVWPRHLLIGRAGCRGASSAAQPPGPRRLHFTRRRPVLLISAIAVTTLGLGAYQVKRADAATNADERSGSGDCNPLVRVPFRTLVRGYFVYTCCSIPLLVDWGPALVDWCKESTIPGVWHAFEYAVRSTFFPQFVGGETAEECVGRIKELSRSSIGVILNYSAEVDEKAHGKSSVVDDADMLCKDKVDEILHSIQTSGQWAEQQQTASTLHRDNDSVMVAIKLSGLVKDASVLERASACLVPYEHFSHPPTTTPSSLNNHGPCANLISHLSSLSQHDSESLRQLWAALQSMATCARENGNIRLLIDAEYSWYQPAIDALFEACARQFNTVPARSSSSWLFFGRKQETISGSAFQGPLVYNTLQAYLRRTPSYLAMSLERARQGGYALGIKLVRGAYVDQENGEWSSKAVRTPPSEAHGDDNASPVWSSKALTDRCYNECADLLIRNVAKDVEHGGSFARLAIVLAGHNWTSNMIAIQTMIDSGLAQQQHSLGSTPSLSPSPYYQLQLRQNVRGRIHFAQLYGMADELTRAMQLAFDNFSGGPGPHLVLKYIPYGDLRLVMPYLMRRARENKSVMGGGTAQKERAILAAEMRRRLLWTWS